MNDNCSNGKLDPWNTGAVTTGNVGTQSWTRGVYVFEMTDAANQLDFRQPNSCDPPSVTDARQYVRICFFRFFRFFKSRLSLQLFFFQSYFCKD